MQIILVDVEKRTFAAGVALVFHEVLDAELTKPSASPILGNVKLVQKLEDPFILAAFHLVIR